MSDSFAQRRVSKHRLFVWLAAPTLPDSATFAFARADDFFFGVLHSRIHEVWARIQGTQVRERESGFRYTPTTCFETFPFPFADDLAEQLENLEAELNAAKHYAHIVLREEPPPRTPTGASHRDCRRRQRVERVARTLAQSARMDGGNNSGIPRLGRRPVVALLDPSNRQRLNSAIGLVRYPRLEPSDADCAAKLKERTLTKLYNERPAWLDLAHKKLDAAVAAAYGFPADLTDEQILEKLLALNLERAAEEAKAAKVKKNKAQRTKEADELL